MSNNNKVNKERAGTDLIILSLTFRCIIIAPSINKANSI